MPACHALKLVGSGRTFNNGFILLVISSLGLAQSGRVVVPLSGVNNDGEKENITENLHIISTKAYWKELNKI